MKKGFTLIEVIAVLVLVSILVLGSTLALQPLVMGLTQARANTDAVQKTHLALARLSYEFTTITNIVSSGSQTLIYDFLTPAGATIRRTVAWGGQSGDLLTLDGVALSDDVDHFELRYYEHRTATATTQWTADSKLIEIIYGTQLSGDLYTIRICPRNIPGGS